MNLTRDEARARAEVVQTSSYEVSLDVTAGAVPNGPGTFRSVTTVRFTATPGASTFIDAITKTVHAVTLNGTALDPADVSDGVRIRLDDLAAENELVVDADALFTNSGEGLHRFVDPVDDEVYLYSQFEVPDSRRMFAAFEQPDLKATFAFTVRAPEAWQVVSNQPTPEPVSNGDGSATWTFEPTPVLSSYITALVAGPYVVERSELTSADGRTIPLGVFSRASLAPFMDADAIFDITRKGFAFYEELFAYPYPFDKYDQLFVPEFNAGAMENAGAITFTETYVFRSKVSDAVRERRVVTILHELAHMWFGDLVTMRWWNDLWLNESFAEFASTLATAEATEWTEAWATFASTEKSWAYAQDQLPSTHPIVAEIRDLQDVEVNFDGITYAKGASVLKQLAAWVGRDDFFAGLRAYFQKNAFSNTELVDLLTELETTSGRDLSAWSTLWLETAGVNTLSPEIETDADGNVARFTIVQTAIADYPTIRPHRLAVGFYTLTGETLERTTRVELDVDGERTDVAELVGVPVPDLALINDDDLAYAKIRMDDHSLTTAIEHLRGIADPLARSLVWGSAWDATRDAENAGRAFVALVLGNIATETESTTLRTALAQLVTAITMYTAEDTRDRLLAEAGDRLWELTTHAEPDSDAQFQFLKFFAATASTIDHANTIQALLSGAETIEGLHIDTDLGWELLTALVVLGKAGEDEIAAYLAGDNTANGAQSAATARAALPTAEGKAAAWASVIDSDALPNTIVRSTALGFRRTLDASLLQPYIERYFGMLDAVWSSRTFKIAEYIVVGFYPAPLASQELADATRAWLDANAEAPSALRRIIVENLAGVERALRAQAVDE